MASSQAGGPKVFAALRHEGASCPILCRGGKGWVKSKLGVPLCFVCTLQRPCQQWEWWHRDWIFSIGKVPIWLRCRAPSWRDMVMKCRITVLVVLPANDSFKGTTLGSTIRQ